MPGANFIYGLVDPRTLLVRYVGLSSTGMERPWEHTSPSKLNREQTYKANWLRELIRADLRPSIVILQECPKEHLKTEERWWIAYGRACDWPLTNHTDGGDGTFGFLKTAATRAKLSAAQRGKPKSEQHRENIRLALLGRKRGPDSPEYTARRTATLKGQKRTPEQRARMRAAQLRLREQGYIVSDETRAKMSASQLGRKHSAESIAKIAAAHRGRPKTPEHRERIRQSLLGRKSV